MRGPFSSEVTALWICSFPRLHLHLRLCLCLTLRLCLQHHLTDGLIQVWQRRQWLVGRP